MNSDFSDVQNSSVTQPLLLAFYSAMHGRTVFHFWIMFVSNVAVVLNTLEGNWNCVREIPVLYIIPGLQHVQAENNSSNDWL
jgi:hypothetical protein